MTRPVLALLLVGAVVILAAASLSIGDAAARNLLVGGVVSLSSAAAAYYFASSGATEARRDLMKATSPASAPQLEGKTVNKAQIMMSGLVLALELPTPIPDPSKKILTQDPKPGTMISHHDPIKVVAVEK